MTFDAPFIAGPNACSSQNPCMGPPLSAKLCLTGSASGSPDSAQYVCLNSFPSGHEMTPSGLGCFSSQAHCHSGANACNAQSPCVFEPSLCSYGSSANAGFYWACVAQIPRGALPNSAGLFCFDSIANCHSAPNACSAVSGTPCTFDATLCSSGLALTSSNSFFCNLSMPRGASLAASGVLCYEDNETCLLGPNSCNSLSPCGSPLFGICSSGYVMCPLDLPQGAIATSSGLCFTSSDECATGTACDFFSQPCAERTSCPSSAPFVCRLPAAAKTQPYHVSFALEANNVTRDIELSVSASVASMLSVSVSDVDVSANGPGSATTRRLLSVQLVVDITCVNASIASQLSSSISAISSQDTLSLPPGVQAPPGGLVATVMVPPSATPRSISSFHDLSLELAVSRPTIWITRDLAPPDTSGNETMSALIVLAQSNITIIGNVTACMGLCTLDAGYLSQHFIVFAEASLTLVNLALINGAARGTSGTDVTLNGGSINAGADATLAFINCILANNSALYGTGGAVFSRGNVVFDRATTDGFSNNSAAAGLDSFVCNRSNAFFDDTTASCTACPPGQLPFQGKCNLCTTNTYWPGGLPLAGSEEADRGVCTRCPALTSTSGQGAPHVAFCNCPAGFYRSPISAVSDPGSIACLPCPTGAVCPGEGDNRAYALANYWRGNSVDSPVFYSCDQNMCVAETFVDLVAYTSHTLGDLSLPYPLGATTRTVYTSADAGGLLCSVLHQDGLCVGNLRESNCAQGAEGLVCSRCAPGYANQIGFCKPCTDSDKITNWTVAGRILAAVMGSVSVILFMMVLAWYPLLSSAARDLINSSIEWVVSRPSHIMKSVTRKLSLAARMRREEKLQRQRNRKRLFAAMGRHYGGLFVCLMIIVGDLQLVGSFKDSMAIPWPKAYAVFSAVFRAASIQPFNMPRCVCVFMHQPQSAQLLLPAPALLCQPRLHCA